MPSQLCSRLLLSGVKKDGSKKFAATTRFVWLLRAHVASLRVCLRIRGCVQHTCVHKHMYAPRAQTHLCVYTLMYTHTPIHMHAVSAMQLNAMQRTATQHNAVPLNSMQCRAVPCRAMPCLHLRTCTHASTHACN
eukprot:13228020-Alexandrium_andersonii.AAC.1